MVVVVAAFPAEQPGLLGTGILGAAGMLRRKFNL